MEAGVALYYGQSLVDAGTENGEIESVLISTKAGLKALRAKVYIDCTGDGDLAAFAVAQGIAVDDVDPERVKAALDRSGAIIPGKEREFDTTLI